MESDVNILKIPKRHETFTKKTALKNIILSNKCSDITNIINNLADKVNKLVIHTYHFLKCWILSKYSKNEELPKITLDVIGLIFKTLIDNTSTRKKQKKE